MTEVAAANQRQSWLDRSLSLFTEVHAGEGVSALLLAANVFALLAFYYILKTVRESLILTEGGAEVKSYAAAGQALLLLVVIPAYGAVAARVNRVRLISGVSLFFASHLVIFYLLGAAGVKIGIAFYLWIGIFNLVIIAQFWAFANDVYTNERGKRLFPIVGLGASLGAWVGALIASEIFAAVGPYRLMIVSAIGLSACVLLTLWIDRRERERAPAHHADADAPIARTGGFSLVFSSRYLLLIAMLVVVLNVVNTVGEFILGKLVVEHAAGLVSSGAAGGASASTIIGQFYGDFFAWVNLVGFLFQLVLVSRIFKHVGVRGALFVLPLIATFSYGMLAVLPILAIVRIAKILENSADYSINNTARHALFLPTSREAKYNAQQAIDSFFWRAGDLLQAVIVFIGAEKLAFGIRAFAAVNLTLVMVWLVLVFAIGREYRKLTDADSAQKAA
jgi:AAA family ATP:ADP antiporter